MFSYSALFSLSSRSISRLADSLGQQSKLHLVTGEGNDIAANLADLLVEKMEEDLPGEE